MRFASTAKVVANVNPKYYGISQCVGGMQYVRPVVRKLGPVMSIQETRPGKLPKAGKPKKIMKDAARMKKKAGKQAKREALAAKAAADAAAAGPIAKTLSPAWAATAAAAAAVAAGTLPRAGEPCSSDPARVLQEGCMQAGSPIQQFCT